jgi:peptidylprolyl isomerase
MLTKRFPALALAAVATLGLTACGADGSPSTGSSASPTVNPGADAAALASVEWTEAADGSPVLTFDQPLSVSGTVARMEEDGDGEVIESGQILLMDYVVFSGTDGSIEYSTYENGAAEPVAFVEGSVEPSMWEVLNGSHVGVRFVVVGPDSSVEPVDGAYPSYVVAATIVGATPVLTRAEGEAVAPAAGLPSVTLAENGAPSIDFTGVEIPDGMVVQPLIVGTGAPVTEGQNLTVHYTGWLWDGEVFDSSWESGTPASFYFATGYLIDGWIRGLTGQPVGSQVLLIVPPELGYGDNDMGAIPAGSTLVFVVDILAAY